MASSERENIFVTCNKLIVDEGVERIFWPDRTYDPQHVCAHVSIPLSICFATADSRDIEGVLPFHRTQSTWQWS